MGKRIQTPEQLAASQQASAERQALRFVGKTAQRAKEASQNRDMMIRDALEVGCSIREVAKAADLSPARVHQIRHGR